VYLSLPHFTLQPFLVSGNGNMPLENLTIFANGCKIHFVIEKNQFRGEYLKFLYQNKLEVGLLPTPGFDPGLVRVQANTNSVS